MKKIKIMFMGTPDFCLPVLEGLIDNYGVSAIVTQPDREVGRKKELKCSPVKELGLKHKIKILQPKRIRKEYEEVLAEKPDLIVTCAYGQIIPKEILELPKYGCINVHASLLPKFRGGAPIQRAIMNNEYRTGVTIMYMDEGMDTGDIISSSEILIEKNDNFGTLHDKLSVLGRDLLLKTLPDIISGKAKRIKQDDDEMTLAPIIKREDEQIDFKNKTALEIHNQIRALNPYPGSYAILDGKVMKIYDSYIRDDFYNNKENGEIVRIYDDGIGVSCKDYELVITKIKPEGKKEMYVKDYFNGIDRDSLIGKIFNEE